MFGDIGAPELLIIGLVVVLLFGVGKIGSLGKDLGQGVREFRRAMSDDDDAPAPAPPIVHDPAGSYLAAPAQRVYVQPVAPAPPQQAWQPPSPPPTWQQQPPVPPQSSGPNVF